MKNMKFWRTALVAALVLTIMLSVTGGTIAWFTDEVTSGSNKIEAGNLDVALLMYNGTAYEDISESTDPIFGAVNNKAQNNNADTIWEPGKTQVAYLAIKNNGNLALKYNVGLNVVSETKNLSEAMKYAISSDAKNGTGVDGWNAADAQSVVLGQQSASGAVSLGVGETHYFALSIHMDEAAGNQYQGGTAEFDITVYATQDTVEEDSFNDQYDAGAVPTFVNVNTKDAAQAALDNAKAGDIIKLAPGVDYGVLELRANIMLDGKQPVSGHANTEKVDYFTGKYTNEFVRKVENVTIVGAPGATVDAIKFVGNTHKIDGASGGTMYRYVDVKNLVIDSVEFTDASQLGAGAGFVSPIFIDLQNVNVDGLTVKNCTVESNADNSNLNFVYAYGKAASGCTFDSALKNLTITDNTVSGIARLCELREAENVTVANNTAKNLVKEFALLANNGDKAYSGDVIFTGNDADTMGGLFVRIGVAGDANVVIKNNIVTNYVSSDPAYSEYMKITENTKEPVIEGNTVSK